MILNGKEIILSTEIFLAEFLEKEGYDINKVAVEKNGVIVAKKDYRVTFLSDGDKIEVVCFVGGG